MSARYYKRNFGPWFWKVDGEFVFVRDPRDSKWRNCNTSAESFADSVSAMVVVETTAAEAEPEGKP